MEVTTLAPSVGNNEKDEAIEMKVEEKALPKEEEPQGRIIQLSEEQQAILDLVLEGKSVFFTGSAGTGKTVLLREIIQKLRGDLGRCIAITASTGIASVHIGGSTLHSFAGVGLGSEPAEKLFWKVRNQKEAKDRWEQTRTLIIDEISMIDGVLFDKLEYVARKIRNSDAPFGGIQLVICGDFFQLPPVPDTIDGIKRPPLFAFEARCWDRCIPYLVTLTKVFRQKDSSFVDMLNEMRLGRLAGPTVEKFKNLSREVEYSDDIKPTELFPLRKEVEDANMHRLRALELPQHPYIARDFPGFDSKKQIVPMKTAKKLLDHLVAPEKLFLRLGAQVMLIKNMRQGQLVNGSIGKVIAFEAIGQSQFEVAKVETDRKSKNEPVLHQVEPEKILQATTTTATTAAAPGSTSQQSPPSWPVVKFENGITLLCAPVAFTVLNSLGSVEAQRDQVPLILAWALSIHKSQGQTLKRVKVNLHRVFEKGQAYVALSRATSLERLQILHFKSNTVKPPDSRVVQFSQRLIPACDLNPTVSTTAASGTKKLPSQSDDEAPVDDDDDAEESEVDAYLFEHFIEEVMKNEEDFDDGADSDLARSSYP